MFTFVEVTSSLIRRTWDDLRVSTSSTTPDNFDCGSFSVCYGIAVVDWLGMSEV